MNAGLRSKLESIDSITGRRKALLDFVSKHYNTDNRAFTTDGAHPVMYPTETSEGDPLGIVMTDDELQGLAGRANEPAVLARLPKFLQDMGGAFLFELQRMHDKGKYWCQFGLTQEGVHRYNDIKNVYCNE